MVYLGLLVVVRGLGLLTFLSIPGVLSIPFTLRLLFGVGLGVALTPLLLPITVTLPPNILIGAIVVGREFLTGLAFSAAIILLFSTLQMTGEFIGRMGGISVASFFDPAGGEGITPLSLLFSLMGVAVFIAVGGVEAFLSGYLDSFIRIPPGELSLAPAHQIDLLLAILVAAMQLTLKMAAPVIITTLIVLLALGILGRVVPQLPVMSVGLSTNTLLVLALVFLSLGAVFHSFENQILHSVDSIFGP